jgi:hypothetical protein
MNRRVLIVLFIFIVLAFATEFWLYNPYEQFIGHGRTPLAALHNFYGSRADAMKIHRLTPAADGLVAVFTLPEKLPNGKEYARLNVAYLSPRRWGWKVSTGPTFVYKPIPPEIGMNILEGSLLSPRNLIQYEYQDVPGLWNLTAIPQLFQGRTLTETVRAIDVSFASGAVIHDTAIDGTFAIFAPAEFGAVCTVTVLDRDNHILERIPQQHSRSHTCPSA